MILSEDKVHVPHRSWQHLCELALALNLLTFCTDSIIIRHLGEQFPRLSHLVLMTDKWLCSLHWFDILLSTVLFGKQRVLGPKVHKEMYPEKSRKMPTVRDASCFFSLITTHSDLCLQVLHSLSDTSAKHFSFLLKVGFLYYLNCQNFPGYFSSKLTLTLFFCGLLRTLFICAELTRMDWKERHSFNSPGRHDHHAFVLTSIML